MPRYEKLTMSAENDIKLSKIALIEKIWEGEDELLDFKERDGCVL